MENIALCNFLFDALLETTDHADAGFQPAATSRFLSLRSRTAAADALWSLKSMSDFSKQRQSGCGSSSRASASESDALPCLRCLRFFYSGVQKQIVKTSQSNASKKISKKSPSKIWVICSLSKRGKQIMSFLNQLKANSSGEEFTRGGGGGLRLHQVLRVLQVLRNLGFQVQQARPVLAHPVLARRSVG